MSPALPDASIRRQVMIPLRFADGYTTPRPRADLRRTRRRPRTPCPGPRPVRGGGSSRALHRRPVPLVRPHSECLTGDVFGSQRCDCGAQLREAVERIAEAGGYLLYLRQEGRGIGLYSKLDAYLLQDAGLDTYEANLALGHAEDERDYTSAAQMLAALDVNTVALLSNNPDKAAQLTRLGVTVTDAGADRGAPVGDQRGLPRDEGLARRAHPLPHPQRPAGPGQRQRRPRPADGQALRVERQRWIEAADDAPPRAPAQRPRQLRRTELRTWNLPGLRTQRTAPRPAPRSRPARDGGRPSTAPCARPR